MTIELILLITALLLVLSLVVSTASNQLGIPALVLFLVIGMLAGSDGIGGIAFDNAWIAQFVGVVALIYILFSGGLDTNWQLVRPVLRTGLILANFGAVFSMLLVGGFAIFVFNLDPLMALLLGAIISSTDAAAVFSVMRTRGVNLKGDLEPLIELESGSNDPIAVFLTLGMTQLLIQPDASLWELGLAFVLQMVVGGLCGYGMGRGMTWLVNRLPLRQEGLYSVLTLALVLLVYGLTSLLRGNGFLAVYVAGIVMGNRNFIHKRSLLRFHEGIAWLMQISMFLTLGLFVFPSRLIPVAPMGLILSLFLLVIARPLSVYGALAFTRFKFAEQTMVAWAGLRGAVPIILATFPLLAGVPGADIIFHLIFFVVLTSVIIQGMSIGWMAQWLKVNAPQPLIYHHELEFIPDVTVNSQLVELRVAAQSPLIGKSVVQLGLPREALIVLVRRGAESLVPNGATVFEANDRLLLLANADVLALVQKQLNPNPSAKSTTAVL
jgi:cell volume regulation protein A